MMRLKYLLAGVLMCAAINAHSHPLHLSFTNLEFNTKTSRWQLTIKVFTDDFSSNLKTSTGQEAVIGTKDKSYETEKLLKLWLDKKFLIWFDTRPVEMTNWKLDGIKVKDDATWLTFLISAPLPVSEIRIRNSILLDLYSDQKNLFILVMGQTQSAFEFKNKDQETVIKLNK